ncbi:MAG: putative metal-dependent rane protease [Bacteroidota bacterium]|nr:putative metal-dependent rane protease [Bacteroidota bacterium]
MIDADGNKPLNQVTGINKYSFEVQLLIWLGIFTGCFIAAQLVCGGIIIAYYKSADLTTIASRVSDLNVLRYTQMLSSVLGFLLPALIFSKLKDTPITKFSNANKGFHPILLILVPLLIFTIYPLINASYFINKWMPWSNWMQDSQGEYKAIVDALLKDKTIFVFILNLFTVAMLPAVCEEWIFRGTLQKQLCEKLNIHIAVLLSAVFFSLIHFEFSGFLPRVFLGIFLGYLFYYSGSLWTNIFAHVVNNTAQIVIMYLSTVGIYKGDVENPEMPKTWELIIYTLGFIALWYVFYIFSQKRNPRFVKLNRE